MTVTAAMLLTTVLAVSLAVPVVGDTAPVAAAGASATAGTAGIGDPYFPLDGNGGINVLHYDVQDTYRFSPARLEGTTTLRIRAKQALSSFHLDLLLPTSSVSVDGTPARFSRPKAHELAIRPATTIARGQVFTVTVAYAGDPRTPSYARERNWLGDGTDVVAMNEPHMAPWWFASNDHPRDKATFDVSITTDADKQVIGNGTQVGRTVTGTSATTRWRTTRPMATYLAFFAAGRYHVWRGTSASGIPWLTAVSARIGGADLSRDRRLINSSGTITDWLQKELGRYPFDSTGGVVTPLDAGFALENQTRPTYSWIDRTTIVHELAHQWFGDSVSLRRWRDVWLNEGFATYLEQRYKEAHGGPSTRKWLHAAYRSWAGDRHFWSVAPASPGRRHLWDGAVYERGAMALAALRDRIGSREFRRLLRSWVRVHRYAGATTAQFERLAQRVSGQHLGGFFRAWLRAPSRPKRTRANGW